MATKQTVGAIWLAFAVIFVALAFFHWEASQSSTPEFRRLARPLASDITVQFAGLDADAPLRAFEEQFNAFLQTQNAASRTSNLISCGGYVGALLTALFSAALVSDPDQCVQDQ